MIPYWTPQTPHDPCAPAFNPSPLHPPLTNVKSTLTTLSNEKSTVTTSSLKNVATCGSGKKANKMAMTPIKAIKSFNTKDDNRPDITFTPSVGKLQKETKALFTELCF
jgi:hypothetical protein